MIRFHPLRIAREALEEHEVVDLELEGNVSLLVTLSLDGQGVSGESSRALPQCAAEARTEKAAPVKAVTICPSAAS